MVHFTNPNWLWKPDRQKDILDGIDRRLRMLGQIALLWLAASTPGREALPFITDDFPRAQAEARVRHVPVFVDVWAPW